MEIEKINEELNDEDKLPKVVRIGMLIDIYGDLLTEKQRKFIGLHFEEDLSFGEIAKEYKVSRQAVHDAVKHAEQTLENYEEKLHLLKKYNKLKSELKNSEQYDVTAIIERLMLLRDRVKKEGIIYNSDWIAQEINAIIEESKS